MGTADARPPLFRLLEYRLHSLSARVAVSSCLIRLAVDDITPGAARGEARANKVGTQALRLTGGAWLGA